MCSVWDNEKLDKFRNIVILMILPPKYCIRDDPMVCNLGS
jgi:hypothetical protein